MQTLHTPRLVLRALQTDDSQVIYLLRSNPEVNEYLDRSPCLSVEDALSFIHKINGAVSNGNAYYWGICTKGSEELIGTFCLFDLSAEKSSCEIGFELLPEFQRQGYMKEAAESVIYFVFKSLSLEKIRADVHENNARSLHLLNKLQFVGTTSEYPEPHLKSFVLVHAER